MAVSSHHSGERPCDVATETLGHFELTDKLGEGGMGVVYRARDTCLGRTVAIKLLRPEAVANPDRTRRFLLEAKAASALTHPHIVTVHDIGEDPARRTRPWWGRWKTASARSSS